MPPIRRICFDAFGTIFSPREAVHVQYAKVARSFGLQVEESKVKAGFRAAYKHWAGAHPLYGKLSTPTLDASAWWRGLILDTFKHAGLSTSQLQPVQSELTEVLIQRFWCREGYALHDDVLPTLSLLATSFPSLPSPLVVSGSDLGVKKVLRDLGTLRPEYGDAGIRDEDIWTTWELEAEKKTTEFWEKVLERLNEWCRESGEALLRASEVLVVGDEKLADYDTPKMVGFQTLLLRRDVLVGEHARSSHGLADSDDEEGVQTIAELTQVVEFVRRSCASTS